MWLSIALAAVLDFVQYWTKFSDYESCGLFICVIFAQITVLVVILTLRLISAKIISILPTQKAGKGCNGMKKTVFGSALMICGMIASCAEYVAQRIEVVAFKLVDYAYVDGNILLSLGGMVLFLAGIAVCVMSLAGGSDRDHTNG